MNANPRRALIAHLIAPESDELPMPVRVELQAQARALQLKGVVGRAVNDGSQWLLANGFEKLIFESSTRERLPLVEMLLASGRALRLGELPACIRDFVATPKTVARNCSK